MRLTSPTNFRPIHSLRPVLYRSDHLGALNEDDARQIQALGIQRVLDFRGVDERTSFACTLSGVTVHSLPIEPTIVQQLHSLIAGGRELTEADVVEHMQETYRGFVRHNTPRFAEFFGHLLESDQPTVFHCTAGKDRTGFAAALLLHAVGASPEAVMEDYLLTNERLAFPAEGSFAFPRPVMQVLWRVQPEFLQAALAEVEAGYGSMEGYLRDGLQLGPAQRQRLRTLYVQP